MHASSEVRENIFNKRQKLSFNVQKEKFASDITILFFPTGLSAWLLRADRGDDLAGRPRKHR